MGKNCFGGECQDFSFASVFVTNFVLTKLFVRYRCCNKSCPVKIKTDHAKSKILQVFNEHNHESLSPRVQERALVIASCRRKAVENVDLVPEEIISGQMETALELDSSDIEAVSCLVDIRLSSDVISRIFSHKWS